ncbi:hypothetical protein PLANPX_1034 [Lacipirellula parvula]|uniref:Uncharacterized protein n=1 Tax=Lacipirellula parvula TaxID=2650471 RepID=A0A5K7X6H3_9BACT|nr:hypothetical protein PLANPX_1034 [Lacipirellula parvula]
MGCRSNLIRSLSVNSNLINAAAMDAAAKKRKGNRHGRL